MSAISLDSILRAEHDILHESLCNWCGLNKDDAMQDIYYLQGVHDMAHKLMEKLDPDGDADA